MAQYFYKQRKYNVLNELLISKDIKIEEDASIRFIQYFHKQRKYNVLNELLISKDIEIEEDASIRFVQYFHKQRKYNVLNELLISKDIEIEDASIRSVHKTIELFTKSLLESRSIILYRKKKFPI